MQPSVVNITSPDGVVGQAVITPVVDANGRVTVKLEPTTRFIDEYRAQPRRRVGTANMADLASLILHTNRFKDADSAVFANTDREHPSITAVLDYHRAGPDAAPRFGQHRSRYAFPVSDEWKAWTQIDGCEMDQTRFAEFLETYIVDVLAPEQAFPAAKDFAQKCDLDFAGPSKMLQLSRGLSIRVGVKIANTINLTSGEKQLVFEEAHTDEKGEALKVPGAFLIGIPVFRSDARYQVCVRHRYRKSNGLLSWTMDLWRHQEVFDHAIKVACDKVKEGTGLPLFVGGPELQGHRSSDDE